MKSGFETENFSPELRLLLSVISTPDFNKATARPGIDCDEKKLIRLAEKHRITPLLYKYLNNYTDRISDRLLSQLKALVREHTFKALNLQSQLIEVCTGFNKQGISYLAIKGPQLSHLLYADAAVRVCVDLDLFLKKSDDILIASELLYKLGYRISNMPEHNKWLQKGIFGTGKHEIAFLNKKTRTYIDLHLRPVGNSFFSTRFHKIIFNDSQLYELNGVKIVVPSVLNYFLFLCHHGAVHQYGSLHWLADIYVFMHRHQLSLDILMLQASRLKLKKHFILSLMLLNRLCGMSIPERYTKEWVKNWLLQRLYRVCIQSIKRVERIEYNLSERFEKTVYRFLLAEGLAGKADTVITVLSRYFYRIVNRRGFGMRERTE